MSKTRISKRFLVASVFASALALVIASPSFAQEAPGGGGGGTTDEASTAISDMSTDFSSAKTLIDNNIVPLAVGSIAFGGAAMLIKRFIYS